MESMGTAKDHAASQSGPPAVTEAADETSSDRQGLRPAPRRRSTRGGDGVSAGSTPKKAYRPSAHSRPRPAGKKPDNGAH